MTTPPPLEAWALALQGIGELQALIKAQGEQIAALQGQLTDVRSAYTRAAPMSVHLALEERVTSLDDRLSELETGATGAILRRLDDDRRERRPVMVAVVAVVAMLLILVPLIWLGVR